MFLSQLDESDTIVRLLEEAGDKALGDEPDADGGGVSKTPPIYNEPLRYSSLYR